VGFVVLIELALMTSCCGTRCHAPPALLRSWLFSLVMLPGQSTPPELPPFLTHLGHEIRMAGEQQRLLVQLAPRIGEAETWIGLTTNWYMLEQQVWQG
jgi:hypothetical protein